MWVILLGAVFSWLQGSFNGISYLIPFLFFISFTLSIVLESCLLVFRNYRLLVTVNILYAVAYCIIHWHAWVRGFSLEYVFSGLVVITLLRLLVYVASVFVEFRNAGNYTVPIAIPKIRTLWLHLGLYDVLQLFFSWIDKFIISFVLTAELSAVYFNGSQNIPFLPLLLGAASSAVLIKLASANTGNEDKDTVKLMLQSGRLLSCIVFPLFFFLLIFRTELITVLLSAKYAASIPIFAVAVLVLPVRAYSFTTVLQRHHKGHIINIGAAADLLLACLLMYPMYLWLGLPGVALSFVITTYLQAAFYLYCSAQLLEMSVFQIIPYRDWLVKLIVFGSLFIVIHYAAARYITPKISLFLGGVVMAAAIAVSLVMEANKQRLDGRRS
jgi:O-antigen/teichoic acid export membrane protein